MILSDFIKGRDIKINAVSNYISRNPDKFKNHVTREGNHTILDDEAVRILENKYPIPKPTIIINGLDPDEERELRQRLADANESLAKARDVMLAMQNEITEHKLLIAEHEHGIALLEERTSHEKALLELQNKELQEKIAKLENRGLFGRIFNKGV